MLSPQVVSADSKGFFDLLAIIANPAEAKKQLQLLKDAADQSTKLLELANATMSSALQKEQEVKTFDLEVKERSRVVEECQLQAQKELESRLASAAENDKRAKAVLIESERQAKEIVTKAEARVVELEARATNAARQFDETQRQERVALERLTQSQSSLNEILRKLK